VRIVNTTIARNLAPPFIEDQFIDSPEFTARWQLLILSP
jgi:hypothetical protein